MELALQHIVNLSAAKLAHGSSHMACVAQTRAVEKDDDPMLKLTLSAAAIVSMSACMGNLAGGEAPRMPW